MVYAVDSYGVVVEVEAELVAHGGEFAGAFAEDVDELLCGCGFDASVVSFELGEDEVEFGFGFFEVWYVFFAGSGSGESKERVIPITVTLTDASATTNFQEVSVTVDLPSEKRTGVLSVPVGALLALSTNQYGVEIVESGGTTRKVPVTIGLFAGGRVEVSGEGISEGQRVVVPQT